MTKRRKARTVRIGNISIGSDHPIAVQSMAKTETADIARTLRQITALEEAGCEMVRVAVKTLRDAKAIKEIKKEARIPLIADIHFDWKLALEAINSGADKIRINPGNISKKEYLERIAAAAKDAGISVRIGVNSGSMPEGGMVKGALAAAKIFTGAGFEDIVISLKASDVTSTVEAYRKIAVLCDFPLHLGVTAAGLPEDGIVRSTAGVAPLLLDGIGDTVRVSLTADPVREVDTAKRILSSLGLRTFGPRIIACPTCGRCQVDLVSIAKEVENKLKRYTTYDIRYTEKPLTIALMGCEVNGPGEAMEADIGIAFGNGKGAIFKDGKIVRTVDADSAIEELLEIMRRGE